MRLAEADVCAMLSLIWSLMRSILAFQIVKSAKLEFFSSLNAMQQALRTKAAVASESLVADASLSAIAPSDAAAVRYAEPQNESGVLSGAVDEAAVDATSEAPASKTYWLASLQQELRYAKTNSQKWTEAPPVHTDGTACELMPRLR